ncbi:ABC transporter permease [Nanchangia anserum]|uniref:FtsX-like permease family protein n=1 Tax=Nanchangia anserum TaxID=2692125 RepID=UPI001883B4E8|nr:FtsX-like permease family protein [Nanchangia anserum]QOX81724.1 ABC transporter permease [Nanchangia anserum]
MRRVVWRGLRANWGRFLLTLLAVMLGVAFLSGTLALRGVLASSFEATLGSFYTYPVYVHGPSDGSAATSYAPLSEEQVGEVSRVEGVASADPIYSTNLPILGPDKQPLGVAGSSLVIIGTREGATPWPKIVRGHAPHGNGEIGLEASAAERLGVRVGDTLYRVSGTDLVPMSVTGLYDYETPVSLIAVGITDPAFAKELMGNPATAVQVGVLPAAGHTDAQVTRDIRAALGADVTVQTREQVSDEANKQVNQALGFINTFLLVFVAIAFFVGIFIIANTFRMSVRAEQRQFATLRALGASTRQVFAVVALQGLIIGLVGSVVGVGLGALLIAGLTRLLDSQFGVVLGSVAMPMTVVVTSIVVGIVVTFLGAVLPAREAALTPPVEAMRAQEAHEKPLRLRALLGGAITLAGIGAIVAVVASDTPSGAMLGCGVAALVVGALMIAPVLAGPVMWLLAIPLRLARPLGRLSLRNALANPRRSAATSAALMIGVMLVTAGSVVAATVRESTQDVVDSQLRADLFVSSITSQASRTISSMPLPPWTGSTRWAAASG